MNTQIELTNQKYIREKTKTPRYALLLKEFNSTTTTLDELVKIFKQSNIRVIFVSDFIQLSQEQPLEEIPLKSKTPRTITDFFKKK
jgi:steroid 5-alpha reductase family enzyme